MNEQTKESLLNEIEQLIAYKKEEQTINPALLEYLTIDDLKSIKNNLLNKVKDLKDEDKLWLEQFKKYN